VLKAPPGFAYPEWALNALGGAHANGTLKIRVMRQYQCGQSGHMRCCHRRPVPGSVIVVRYRRGNRHARRTDCDFRAEAAEASGIKTIVIHLWRQTLGVITIGGEFMQAADGGDRKYMLRGRRILDCAARIAGCDNAGYACLTGTQ
jgi:hypothetical protein